MPFYENLSSKKHHYFYIIIQAETFKYYYGRHSTDNLNDGYFGSGKYLKSAIKKYGKNKFSMYILEEFDTFDQLNDYESWYITKEMIDSPDCYNISPGGCGGTIWNKDHPRYDEIRDVCVKAAAKGCAGRSPEGIERQKQAMSKLRKGVPLTPECIEKLSAATSGPKHNRWGKKGKDNPFAAEYTFEREDGSIEKYTGTIYDYANKSNKRYTSAGLGYLLNGKTKFYKDIIRITKSIPE